MIRPLLLAAVSTALLVTVGCSDNKADAKPADAKPADAKPTDDKPADAKPADDKPGDASAAATEASTLLATRCAACHGTSGKGDGPAAAGLNPKPRSFSDPEWQKSVTDDHIAKVIVEGGAAVS